MQHIFKWIGAILLIALCIFISIDSNRFIYLSLSQTLIAGAMQLLISSIALCHVVITKKVILAFSKVQFFIIAWILFLMLHSFCTGIYEEYRLLYFINSLLFLYSIIYLINNDIINKCLLEWGVVVLVCVNILCLLCQSCGFSGTYSEPFALTGLSENPNVSAIWLAAGIPAILSRMKTSRFTITLLLILIISIIYVIVLQCRTAYVGIAVFGLGYLATGNKAKQWISSMSKGKRYLNAILLTTAIIIASSVLYKMKQNSADGRLFVWKLSAEMMFQKPLGHGFGMFEKEYNLFQADFFAGGHGTDLEKLLANQVFMAYNDYLEQGVETGVPGMLFYASFYIIILTSAYKNRRKTPFLIVLSFAIMAMLNFIYATVQPWLILIFYCALSVCKHGESEHKHESSVIRRLLYIIPILLVQTTVIPKQCQHLFSQLELKEENDNYTDNKKTNINRLTSLESTIGTSEAYWKLMGNVYKKYGNSNIAITCYKKSLEYSSSPYTYMQISNCYYKTGDIDNAIRNADIVRNMIPQNLTSRHRLMMYYISKKDENQAVKLAEEITQMPLKISNQQSEKIQNDANAFLNDINNYIQYEK